MAETRKDAETAFDFFLEAYGPKYEKATACLAKDRDALLSFYDFPAEHWKHVREHLRHMAMVFKLCQGASKQWIDQFAESAGVRRIARFAPPMTKSLPVSHHRPRR